MLHTRLVTFATAFIILASCGQLRPPTEDIDFVAQNPLLDAQFGDGGVAMTVFRGNDSNFYTDAVVQPKGDVIALGATLTSRQVCYFPGCNLGKRFERKVIVARYSSSGQLDQTFGTSGYAVVHEDSSSPLALFERGEGAIAVSLDSVLTSGQVELGDRVQDVVQLTALNAAGELDTAFGDGGKVRQVIQDYVYDGSNGVNLERVFALSDGGYFFIARRGFERSPAGGDELLTLKLLPNGQLDEGYGDQGVKKVSAAESVYDYLIDQQDRLLVATLSTVSGVTQSKITRYLPSGELDTGFGGNGEFLVDVLGVQLNLQSSGDLILSAVSLDSDRERVCLLSRVSQQGTLDPSFGQNGVTSVRDDWCLIDVADVFVRRDDSLLVGLDGSYSRYSKDGEVVGPLGQGSTFDISFEGYSVADLRPLLEQADRKIITVGGFGGALVARYDVDP